MTQLRTSFLARRTLSVALLLLALCLAGLAFSPVTTAQSGVNSPAISPDESPQVAAFRKSVGGSITL